MSKPKEENPWSSWEGRRICAGVWVVFLLVCRGCVDRADIGGVCRVEGGLGDHDGEIRVVVLSGCYTGSYLHWRVNHEEESREVEGQGRPGESYRASAILFAEVQTPQVVILATLVSVRWPVFCNCRLGLRLESVR